MSQNSDPMKAEGYGRVKACTECRQHKLRCDAHLDYAQPCSRCRRMNVPCVVTRRWKRNKRQSKKELILENDRLRQQLVGSSTATFPPAVALEACRHDTSSLSPTESQQAEIGIQNPGLTVASSSRASIDSQRPVVDEPASSAVPRLMYGNVNDTEISDCFNLFFRHYIKFIPDIFDPYMLPDQYHEESPFLFWTIVSTGARKYEDPSLLEKASKALMGVALPSLFSLDNPISSIKAVLLLLLWPLPINTTYKDPSHAFSGAAMQIAIQIGLHINGHEQDYMRTRDRFSESERVLRSRLWLHCITIIQSTNLVGGLPFWMSPVIYKSAGNPSLETTMSPELSYRFRIHQVLTSSIAALSRYIESEKEVAVAGMCSLIDLFDDQIQESIPPDASRLNKLVQICARLAVRSYHFFGESDKDRASGLLIAFSTACRVIEQATVLDQMEDLALFSSAFLMRMMTLAAHIVLRVSKSRLRSLIDLHTAEEAIFKAITFIRRKSIQRSTVFKGKDGADEALHLICRTRLFMSVTFDCYYWWRLEFGGEKYRTEDTEQLPGNTHESDYVNQEHHVPTGLRPTAVEQSVSQQDMTAIQPNYAAMGFDTFPDWEWPAGLSLQTDMNLSLPTMVI